MSMGKYKPVSDTYKLVAPSGVRSLVEVLQRLPLAVAHALRSCSQLAVVQHILPLLTVLNRNVPGQFEELGSVGDHDGDTFQVGRQEEARRGEANPAVTQVDTLDD
jgi:hypothetical protein